MLKTNVYHELRKICLEENTNLSKVLESCGMHNQYSSKMKNMSYIPATLLRVTEKLGYDIEVKFVKREGEDGK